VNRRRTGCVLALAAVLGALAGGVPAARADAGDDQEHATGPLEFGQVHPETLTTGDQDWLRIDLVADLSILRVTVANTQGSCEVWATLQDIDGAQIGQAEFDPKTSDVVSGLAASAGPYYVRVNAGPYRPCTHASYTVRAEVEDLSTAPPVPASRPGAAPAARDALPDLYR
jgi:hypothetical protein